MDSSTQAPAPTPATQAARSAAVEDLLTSLDQLGQRYRGDNPERDRHRGDDAERIIGEIARQLAIARVRLAATTLPHDQDSSFTAAVQR